MKFLSAASWAKDSVAEAAQQLISWACVDIAAPIYKRSDEELLTLIERKDDRHRLMRAFAFIELYYRAGCFDPSMPYRVWSLVMGPDVPPPVSTLGGGAFPLPYDWRRGGWGAPVH